MARKRALPTIAASEVAEFVFCAKAWQLRRQGEAARSSHLKPGQEFHESHYLRASFAGKLRRAGVVCALIALLLFVAAMLLRGLGTQMR